MIINKISEILSIPTDTFLPSILYGSRRLTVLKLCFAEEAHCRTRTPAAGDKADAESHKISCSAQSSLLLLPLFIMHSPYNVIVNIFSEKGEDETVQPVLQA